MVDNTKNKQNKVANMLFLAAALLALAVPVKIAFTIQAGADEFDMSSVAEPNDPNILKNSLEKSKRLAEAIKKENLFIPPKKKSHPVKEVRGIMGKEAFINGKWYKTGAKIGDANLVEVHPTYVIIEWQGNKKNFAPLAAADMSKPRVKRKRTITKKEEVKNENGKKGEVVEEATQEKSEEEDMFAWLGVELSPRLRAAFERGWGKLPAEKREEMKKQWEAMPQEQKEQMIDHMEQNIDEIEQEIDEM